MPNSKELQSELYIIFNTIDYGICYVCFKMFAYILTFFLQSFSTLLQVELEKQKGERISSFSYSIFFCYCA